MRRLATPGGIGCAYAFQRLKVGPTHRGHPKFWGLAPCYYPLPMKCHCLVTCKLLSRTAPLLSHARWFWAGDDQYSFSPVNATMRCCTSST